MMKKAAAHSTIDPQSIIFTIIKSWIDIKATMNTFVYFLIW